MLVGSTTLIGVTGINGSNTLRYPTVGGWDIGGGKFGEKGTLGVVLVSVVWVGFLVNF